MLCRSPQNQQNFAHQTSATSFNYFTPLETFIMAQKIDVKKFKRFGTENAKWWPTGRKSNFSFSPIVPHSPVWLFEVLVQNWRTD
jgi:hypothetical protein